MTCREKLRMEKPGFVDEEFKGGCFGCPSCYGYLDDPIYCDDCNDCTKCWDREIIEEDEGYTKSFRENLYKMNEHLKKIEDRAIKKLDEECSGFDQESNHLNADDIICDALRELGLDKLAQKFDSIDKWYTVRR